jgi:hypothetical protein
VLKEILSNEVFKRLFLSFGVTLTVSILAALFLLNFGFNFFITALFFFIFQIIGFYFYGEHIKRKNAYIQAQLEIYEEMELRKITADVVCPCDKKVQTTIPIDMSSDNSYICSQCNKKIGVILDVKTVLKTDPIVADPLTNPVLIENVEKALLDPSHNDRI